MIRYVKTADRWVAAREMWLVPLVAALLFTALALYVSHRDQHDFGPYDGWTYDSLGWETARSEHLLGKDNFRHSYWSPSWVTTIGIVYRMVGWKPLAVRLLLALCAVGSGLLVNRWTRRRGLPAMSCLLAMILTSSGFLVYRFTAYCHYEVILGFGLVVFSGLVFGGNRWVDGGRRGGLFLLVGSGFLMGYLSLMASKVVLLLVVLPAVQWLSGRRRHALRSTWVVAAWLVVIGGWTVRNLVFFGEFIPLTSNGGINLYIANNPDATGGYMGVDMGGHLTSESRHFTRLALEFMADNPAATVVNMLKRAVRFFNPHYGDQVPVILLFAVALVRFFRRKGWRSDTEGLWFITLPFVFMTIHSVFHYEFRYILPVWPFLAWVGAHAFTGWKTGGPSAAPLGEGNPISKRPSVDGGESQ